jgi:sulfide dehydrogenase [flavocytochrome c] flavoprotein subunit
MAIRKIDNLNRRNALVLSATAVMGILYPLVGRTDDGDDNGGGSTSQSGAGGQPIALATTGIRANVVVVGGGMAGASVAKYLRLWGGSGVNVTLVEPDDAYVSNIMSNFVLTSVRSLSSLSYTWDQLATAYGVVRKKARLQAIHSANRQVVLSDGSVLSYDRLVVAPGVDFDNAYGLTAQDYDTRTPHAWRAGLQTTLLQQQLAAAVNGDTYVMTIPVAPYRCPPGPYERACLVADYLKTRKGPNCRVLILDENPKIQAEAVNFGRAFGVIHAGVVNYQSGVTGIAIDPVTKVVTYTDKSGLSQTVQARVVNPIPPHRASGSGAGGWMAAAGLNNSADGRWAKVSPLSYESTAVAGVHVIGDAAQCGLPKAGHVGNQEAKICADAIVRLLLGQSPDSAPVANSACYSPITATTASWLTAVYQYDPVDPDHEGCGQRRVDCWSGPHRGCRYYLGQLQADGDVVQHPDG